METSYQIQALLAGMCDEGYRCLKRRLILLSFLFVRNLFKGASERSLAVSVLADMPFPLAVHQSETSSCISQQQLCPLRGRLRLPASAADR